MFTCEESPRSAPSPPSPAAPRRREGSCPAAVRDPQFHSAGPGLPVAVIIAIELVASLGRAFAMRGATHLLGLELHQQLRRKANHLAQKTGLLNHQQGHDHTPLRDSHLFPDMIDVATPPRRAERFPRAASIRIALPSDRPATSRFKQAFSRSRSFNRRTRSIFRPHITCATDSSLLGDVDPPARIRNRHALRQNNHSLTQLADDLFRLVISRHHSPPSCQNLKQIPDHSEGNR